jgi:N-acetylneuraminic acid mutarotase
MRKNLVLVLSGLMLSGVLALVPAGAEAEGMWKTKLDMPTARWGLATCVVDGTIYALGGTVNPNGPLAIVEAYDTQTNTWTSKTDMPTPRYFFSASVVNGKIYAIGGSQREWGAGLSAVEEYDPATDTWTAKTNMPTRRGGHSASVVDGIIYVIGGLPAGDIVNVVPTVEAYYPATDTWTRKADMPTKRMWHSSSVVNGKIYAIGGTYAHWVTIKTVEEYDPTTDTWAAKTDLPEGRAFCGASPVDGIIYAIGGAPSWETWSFSTVEAYDPKTDSWIPKAEMSVARTALSTSVVDGKIYAVGGTSSIHTLAETYATVEEYDLSAFVVDFNGDGIVDSADMCVVVDNWNTDYPLCDIAPRPFGDGIVDVQDLVMLSEYLTREIDDPTLTAHWAFDETEGDMAYDSVGDNIGYVMGDPFWQPEAGQVGGAIETDGLDDAIIAGAPLSPSAGPFSVLAWVKGGAPGQGIISEPGGPDWLSLEPTTGYLMTELTTAGRGATILLSQTAISDEDWHRIGFVWDGGTRTLFIDGVVVAEDAQGGLESPAKGFYIGTGNAMAPGTFWSGLIDDVRIYNRAVRP